MRINQNKLTERVGYLRNSTLILLAFFTAFFSRVVDTIGFPSTINFLHFIVLPFSCIYIVFTSRTKNQNQILIGWKLIGGLMYLLGITLASGILNNAGIINIILEFLLLGEPFLLILGIIILPLSPDTIQKFRLFFVWAFSFHILLALIQRYVLRVDLMHHLGMVPADRIQGVFFLSGAGHVVGASVSLTFGVYYLFCAHRAPVMLRIAVFLAAFWQILLADAKQVLLAFMIAGVLLIITQLKNPTRLIQYLVIAITLFGLFFWSLQNLEAFASYNVWIKPELYGPNGQATLLKAATFRIVPSHYTSFLNWFLGLGPGHTVGRLGGWMLHKYKDLFGSLCTIHQASFDVWREASKYYISSRSSMFSPLFGWAGIWGDLGFLGLGAYLWLGWIVWHHICLNNICRFLVLTVFVFGLIFSQMEEPGYMLSVAAIIALQWHENQNSLKRY